MTEEKRRNDPSAPRAPAVPPARPRAPSAPGTNAVKQAPTPLRVPGPGGGGISPRPPSVTAADSTGPMPALDAAGHARPNEPVGVMPQIAIEAKLADFTAWRRDADRKLTRLEGELSELRSHLATALATIANAPRVDRSRDQTAPILPEFKALAETPAVWSSVAAGLAPAPAAAETATVSAVAPSAPISAPAAPAAVQAGAPSPSVPTVIVAPDSTPAASPPRVVSIASAPRAPHIQFDLHMRPGETLDLPDALDGGRRKRVVGWLFVAMIFAAMAALVISSLASQR